MRFQLLGPLSITDGPDTAVLQPSKPTSLLAAMLLHPGNVVSTGYLLRAIWDEEQPATARAALQTCVLRLRKIFAKYGIANNAIEAVPGGYRMPADPDTLDLLRFRELVRSADQVRKDPEAELYRLREALTLWQGPLLANVNSRMLHRDEVPRLTEERIRALERAYDIELALGRCRQAMVGLWEAARAHPGHERFSEQLIEALYRTGRQAEAFEEYRRVKKRLQEDLGVDPGPSLQRLELAIIRGDDLGPAAREGAELALPPGAGTPAPAPSEALQLTAAPQPLPPVPCFTGRAADSGVITGRLLRRPRPGPALVVISGAPGIGKTALALQTAHRVQEEFPDGCSVLPMTRPDGTPLSSEEALAELGPPAGGDRRALLVLDDVASADQVRPLLPTASGSAVVITSRRGLAALVATHGGLVHRLGTLAPGESLELLANICGPERIEAEPGAARSLAEVCGHFPLGLRIAAARLLMRPALRIADCADWLAEDLPARLSLADDPRMSVPYVLDGALDRLEPELTEAFVRVGGHDSSTLTAREQADRLGGPETAERVLERLVDAGLLEDGPPGPYRMHGLLRSYARRMLRHREDRQHREHREESRKRSPAPPG
ncbi:AfsR/SARP family transcriptional regulator [Streptomyces sp. TP-A0874]|uniref:AfsR/SARP family transcriptional regulator n=1 Tax=Streptomyces sp. TP-A0874 TaxID=549819 RepID=UPI0008535848|nr:AfsR/SARP family transcriptional regulator [Streptomyces sp. TP-A0874]